MQLSKFTTQFQEQSTSAKGRKYVWSSEPNCESHKATADVDHAHCCHLVSELSRRTATTDGVSGGWHVPHEWVSYFSQSM